MFATRHWAPKTNPAKEWIDVSVSVRFLPASCPSTKARRRSLVLWADVIMLSSEDRKLKTVSLCGTKPRGHREINSRTRSTECASSSSFHVPNNARNKSQQQIVFYSVVCLILPIHSTIVDRTSHYHPLLIDQVYLVTATLLQGLLLLKGARKKRHFCICWKSCETKLTFHPDSVFKRGQYLALGV